MGSLSIWHWLIVLSIVIVIFGTKKLRTAGSDLGDAVKSFKRAMADGEAEPVLVHQSPASESAHTHSRDAQ